MLRTTGILALLTSLLCPVCRSAPSQSLGSVLNGNQGQSSAAPTTPADSLGRTTPHNSIYRFLEACHKGKYNVAAQYLDLGRLSVQHRASQGPELAAQLGKL